MGDTPSASTLEAAESLLFVNMLFDAPRERVFRAWTDPQQLAQWWGPRGFTTQVCDVDVRPGGSLHIQVRSPEGSVFRTTGVYEEILEPERLVFGLVVLDGEDRALFEVHHLVIFAEPPTTLILQARVFNRVPEAEPYLEAMPRGWGESLERLGQYLELARSQS